MSDPAIEALAEAWATMDGKAVEFRDGRGKPIGDQPGGHYEGYMVEAEEVIHRLRRRGFRMTQEGGASIQAHLAAEVARLRRALKRIAGDRPARPGEWAEGRFSRVRKLARQALMEAPRG